MKTLKIHQNVYNNNFTKIFKDFEKHKIFQTSRNLSEDTQKIADT